MNQGMIFSCAAADVAQFHKKGRIGWLYGLSRFCPSSSRLLPGNRLDIRWF